MKRLDRILREVGIASRKELRGMISSGRVSVNGRQIWDVGEKVDDVADIRIDGILVSRMRPVVLLLNKPAGYLTAARDAHAKTVMDLIPAPYRALGVQPIGRLDKDTEGVLLFTNDGALLHRMISPRHGVEKTYVACHAGTARDADVAAFSEGLELLDGMVCRRAVLRPLGVGMSEIVVWEGKYHQVRRMMASRGLTVSYLRRVSEGGIVLGDLPRGSVRELSYEDVCAVCGAEVHSREN